MTEKRMLGASLRMRMRPKKKDKTGDFCNKKKSMPMKFLKCYMDGTPKIVGFPPKSSILMGGFHYFHHPFWGTPIFGNTHIGQHQ